MGYQGQTQLGHTQGKHPICRTISPAPNPPFKREQREIFPHCTKATTFVQWEKRHCSAKCMEGGR